MSEETFLPDIPVPVAGTSDDGLIEHPLQVLNRDVSAMLCSCMQKMWHVPSISHLHIHREISPDKCTCGMCTSDWLHWAESVVPTGSLGDLRYNPELVSRLQKLGPRVQFLEHVKNECPKLLFAYVRQGPFQTKTEVSNDMYDQSNYAWVLCLSFIAWTRLRLTSVSDAKKFVDALMEMSPIFTTQFIAYMKFWEIAHMPKFHSYFANYWGNGMGLLRCDPVKQERLPVTTINRIYKMLPTVGRNVWRDIIPYTNLQWFEDVIFNKFNTFMNVCSDHRVVFTKMSLIKCLTIVRSTFILWHTELADFLAKWLLDIHLPMISESDIYTPNYMLKLALYDPSHYHMFKHKMITRDRRHRSPIESDCFKCPIRKRNIRIRIGAKTWYRYLDQFDNWDFFNNKWETSGTTLRTLFDAAYGRYIVNQLFSPFDGHNVCIAIDIEKTLEGITVLPSSINPSRIMIIRMHHPVYLYGGPVKARIAARMWLALLMHDRYTIARLLLVSKHHHDTLKLLHTAVTQFYTDLRAAAEMRDPAVPALDDITLDVSLTPRESVMRMFTVAAIDKHLAYLARPLQIRYVAPL